MQQLESTERKLKMLPGMNLTRQEGSESAVLIAAEYQLSDCRQFNQ